MNDDPAPSSAPRQPQHPDHVVDESLSDNNRSAPSHGDAEAGFSTAAEVASEETSSQTRRSRRARRRRKKHKEGLAKKLEFLMHLHKSLDMLVFAYLCTVYYMECSATFLLIRLFPHYMLLSHKDLNLHLRTHRPYVVAILLPNLLCMLSHMLFSLPEAGEITRGYLHGGSIIDFVGQRPVTWRSGLLYFDAVVLGLQCVMLAVHLEKERIRSAISPLPRALIEQAAVARAGGAATAAVEETATTEGADTTTQDRDAEERGVLRDEHEPPADEDEDSNETQPLMGAGGDDNNAQRQDERIGIGQSQLRGNADLVDVLASGNGVLGTFHVVHAMRTAGNNSDHTVGFWREYAAALTGAMAADRRARLASLQGPT
ncbi:Fungal domain of unknown function (DUF1746) domain containing protein [Rhypophila sp. PSN 637]